MANASNTTAPTQFVETKLEKYAYRRFGKGDLYDSVLLQCQINNREAICPMKCDFRNRIIAV
jgi:hypothetical protein